eukprot:scaffold10739_cov18-Tisochrysis_lutea.AAC.1
MQNGREVAYTNTKLSPTEFNYILLEFASKNPRPASLETDVADPVSRNPLLHDPAKPENVTCVGGLGFVAAIMTRGHKRALGLGTSAGKQFYLAPESSKSEEVPPEMMLRRQPLNLGIPRSRH